METEIKKTKKIERPHLATAQERFDKLSNAPLRTLEEAKAQIKALKEARVNSPKSS